MFPLFYSYTPTFHYSTRYLKNVVLPDLESRHEILKFHRVRPPTPEEREMLATPPPKPTKRKVSFTPGKRLPRCTSDGLISEWLWRLKTAEDVQRDGYFEQLNREMRARAEEQRKKARVRAINAKQSRHTSVEKSQRERPQPGLVYDNDTKE